MAKQVVKVVCAISSPQGIFGEGNDLPWKVGRPNEDFRRFRELTGEKEGGSVIMGRKTWESLPPSQRPLKGRQNIILTHNIDFVAYGAEVCHFLDEALEIASGPSISIIGGRWLIKEVLARKRDDGTAFVDELHLTCVYMEELQMTEETKFFKELLDVDFFHPLICRYIEPHVQPMADGSSTVFEFRRYMRQV